MTENETLELLKKANRDNDMVCILPKSDMGKCLIKALEENQRWHISEVNPSIKNVFANMSTQICHNCDHKDEYIPESEYLRYPAGYYQKRYGPGRRCRIPSGIFCCYDSDSCLADPVDELQTDATATAGSEQ